MPIFLTLLLAALVTAVLVYFVLFRLSLRLLGSHLLRRSASKRELVLSEVGKGNGGKIVGFFHPYCNAGGGGERVLWAAIRAIQDNYPHVMCAVYTGDHEASQAAILERVESRFSIKLDPDRILFLYLSCRQYIAASTWPHFTLLGQSLGSLILAWDAFSLLVPDMFIDTMGYAFTLPLAKLLFDIPTAAYVHYPTISTDMLGALPADSTASFKNKVKRQYWLLFAALYSRCGGYVDRVMANGSWTATHISSLWKRSDVSVVFPPCAVTELIEAIPLSINGVGMIREKILLCIAQFRPEKNHQLLIEAFAKFQETTTDHKDAKLVLIGSVRNSEDATRVYDLRLLAREKNVKDTVEFVTDAPWNDILNWLSRAWVGVNAMWNEHFGIGVVEYQAAGLISVVHNSGGPKLDIVVDIDGGPTGFHSETMEEFAQAFEEALSVLSHETSEMRMRARKSSHRFNEETFDKHWLAEFEALMGIEEGAEKKKTR